MKLRGTTAGTPFGVKLTALCWAALTLLAPVAVSACTSSSPTTPTIISPTVTNSPTGTVSRSSASSGTSASAHGTSASAHGTSASGTPGVSPGAASTGSSPHPTVTVTETVTPSPNSHNIPPAAPVTGGGGTAGFQGTLLLVLGVGAIVAGAGGLVYRRWLGRGR
jgi:hypothetical protein